MPPKHLMVQKHLTTTTSVTVAWQHDSSKSHIEKWRVTYTLKDMPVGTSIDTTSASVLRKTIGGLTAGQNYTISVSGVTRGGIVSHNSAQVEITVSKCVC